MIEQVQREVATADGHRIVARLLSAPASASTQGSVLIVPAMGVTQKYYAPFAEWLAAQGFRVATFDYRGTGLSRRGSLRGFHADIIEDWAGRDCAAMIDLLEAERPAAPLYWVGHSLGGQIFPFVPNNDAVTKAVMIAAGSGYWRVSPPRLRRTIWWLWYVAAPLSVRLFDYFPGKRLRKVGDLPRRVMEQWRRWCLDPDYVLGVEGESAVRAFRDVTQPITLLSFTDDEYMSARSTDSLHAFYANAPVTARRLAPEAVGTQRVGHFGFFRSRLETALWKNHLLPELQ